MTNDKQRSVKRILKKVFGGLQKSKPEVGADQCHSPDVILTIFPDSKNGCQD